MQYPRILLISAAALNNKSGTGVTLSNLFKGWPAECLAQVYGGIDAPDEPIRAWKLGLEDVPGDRLGRGLGELFSLKLVRPKMRSLSASPCTASQTSVRAGLSAWADLLRYRIPPTLWDAISAFAPQLILSNLGSIRQIQLTTVLAEKLGVWVVPFFHDDWPSTMYANNAMTAGPRLVLKSKLNRCLRQSPTGFGNSHAMAREYTVRYGRPFEAFTNCTEVGKYEPPVTHGDDVNFTYVGGLGLGRWKSLSDVVEAIVGARQQGTKAILNIYGPEQDLSLLPASLLSSGAVRIGGSVSGEDAARAVSQSDVLVHVESFEQAMRDYTRLSFSTKLPLYMAAGRPVLAYGPDEGASCRYVREHGFGIVVMEPAVPRLVAAITHLCASEELRASLGRSAWKRALEEHSSSGMRARFRDVITAIAEVPRPTERKRRYQL